MMDRERIESRLSMLESYSGRIKNMLPDSEAAYRKSQPEKKAATERYLQIISELELDIIVLLYKEKEARPLGSEESVVDSMLPILGSGVVDAVRARRRLRNKLVHAYTNIEDNEVFSLSHNLKDVQEFKKAVKKLLK
ncbi:MAG: DUF86 domain-containing protein [Candidatus Micrarchaeales archaeon]